MQTNKPQLKDDFKTVQRTIQHTCKCCKETTTIHMLNDQPMTFTCSCGAVEQFKNA